MNIPDTIVSWGLGIISTMGMGGFLFLKNKSDKNEKAVVELSKEVNKKFTDQSNTFEESLKLRNKELLDVLKEMEDKLTPKAHCDAKQTEWGLVFKHQNEINSSEHQQLIMNINKLVANQKNTEEAQLTMVASLAQISSCLYDLQKGIECSKPK